MVTSFERLMRWWFHSTPYRWRLNLAEIRRDALIDMFYSLLDHTLSFLEVINMFKFIYIKRDESPSLRYNGVIMMSWWCNLIYWGMFDGWIGITWCFHRNGSHEHTYKFFNHSNLKLSLKLASPFGLLYLGVNWWRYLLGVYVGINGDDDWGMYMMEWSILRNFQWDLWLSSCTCDE